MNAHAIQARTRRGATIELGIVGSLEAAARLRLALEHELGPITILEKEPEAPTVSAVKREELLQRRRVS